MNETMTLANNLKRIRKAKGMRQEDLAQKVGLSQDSISKLELGKCMNPGMKYLIAIARELDIAIEELLMESPQKLTIEIIASEKNMEFIRAFVEVARNFGLVK